MKRWRKMCRRLLEEVLVNKLKHKAILAILTALEYSALISIHSLVYKGVLVMDCRSVKFCRSTASRFPR